MRQRKPQTTRNRSNYCTPVRPFHLCLQPLQRHGACISIWEQCSASWPRLGPVREGEDALLLLRGNGTADSFLMSSKFLLGVIRVHLASSWTVDREGGEDTKPRARQGCSEYLGPWALLSPGTSGSAPGAMPCLGMCMPSSHQANRHLGFGVYRNPES